MDNKLRVVVMTQNDAFFIPKNIKRAAQVCDIVEIVEVDCKSSLENKTKDYFKWFGLWQCARMGFKTISRKFQKIIDKLSKYKKYGGECSVPDVAKALNIPCTTINDSNDSDFVAHIKELNPDLIISYSAPQIIKEELLNTPKHGIINVHGSLLPNYRGCLPSFWYLYNEEKQGGATVHYMSAKIDDGMILKQGSVDISDCKSMFQLMKKTKELGGKLMVQAIEDIANGTVSLKPNNPDEGNYCTWPTVAQAKEFRKKGYRLY